MGKALIVAVVVGIAAFIVSSRNPNARTKAKEQLHKGAIKVREKSGELVGNHSS